MWFVGYVFWDNYVFGYVLFIEIFYDMIVWMGEDVEMVCFFVVVVFFFLFVGDLVVVCMELLGLD